MGFHVWHALIRSGSIALPIMLIMNPFNGWEEQCPSVLSLSTILMSAFSTIFPLMVASKRRLSRWIQLIFLLSMEVSGHNFDKFKSSFEGIFLSMPPCGSFLPRPKNACKGAIIIELVWMLMLSSPLAFQAPP